MLGSDFEGERANAAALLSRSARERKLTLVEFLQRSLQTQPAPSSSCQGESDLLDQLARAVSFERVLTTWEVGFARDVSFRYAHAGQLSEKQRAVAGRIIAKAKRAATAGGRGWGDY